MAPSVVGVMKMGNSVPKVGIEPAYVMFLANVLTLSLPRFPDVTTQIHAYLGNIVPRARIKPKSLASDDITYTG